LTCQQTVWVPVGSGGSRDVQWRRERLQPLEGRGNAPTELTSSAIGLARELRSVTKCERRPRLRRSMRRVSRFTDRVSIGVGASNPHPLSCVSVTTTFRTVQARARAAAGTRRGIYTDCNQPRCVRVACPPDVCDQRQCGIIRPREFAIGNAESLFLRNRVVNIGPRTLRSARDVVVCNARLAQCRNIGDARGCDLLRLGRARGVRVSSRPS
jgi:hypothetical protein